MNRNVFHSFRASQRQKLFICLPKPKYEFEMKEELLRGRNGGGFDFSSKLSRKDNFISKFMYSHLHIKLEAGKYKNKT